MNTVVFHLEEEPTAEEIVETEMTLRVEELPTHAWAEVEEVVQQQVVEPLTLLSSHTPQSQPQPQPQPQSQSQPDPQTPPALAWKPWEGPRPAAAPAARPEASTPPPPPIARTEAPVEKDDFLSRQFARAQRLQMYTRRFKSPGGIADLENEPAYKRRNVVLDDVAPSTATSVSRFALSEEVDEHGDRRVELRSDNPFLHDNVD